MISKRIQQLKPSPTLGLDTKVKQLQAKGISVVNLGLGEPDFITPSNICRAGISAIKMGFTHYTVTSGIPELKEVICKKLLKENGILYPPRNYWDWQRHKICKENRQRTVIGKILY